MRKLDITEIHQRLLELARVFDETCTRHDIPYYMLGGTMLGAIRHKGFIPWDDDMDFGVPAERYDELIALLKTELPRPFRCCTYDDYEAVYSPFAKIDDSETCIDDYCVRLPIERKIGLNIDIFPLYRCERYDTHMLEVRRILSRYVKVYVKSTEPTLFKSFAKTVLRAFYPVDRKEMLDKMLAEMKGIVAGPYLANVFGVWGEKETIPMEYYGNGVRYPFESITLCGLKEYDLYLKNLYGDYMQLPPEGKRHLHADNVYMR